MHCREEYQYQDVIETGFNVGFTFIIHEFGKEITKETNDMG